MQSLIRANAFMGDLATEFFAAPPDGDGGHLHEIVDKPCVLLGVPVRGGHTKFLTAGRWPVLCEGAPPAWSDPERSPVPIRH